MGEAMGNDALIMPFISSANIACGYHAGDEETIRITSELAIRNNVAIGAHPSFPDWENFGRREMNSSPDEIYQLVIAQLTSFTKIIKASGGTLHHVKPHGALYNMSAKDPAIAKAIARAVFDFDRSAILFGLSGSPSTKQAESMKLKTANEVFADRTFQDDGTLTPRSQPNAVLEETGKMVNQVLQMITEKKVTTVNGKNISVRVDTICVHGDGKNAFRFAKSIYEHLKERNIDIKAI
jgi:5-oxoprolinase (ATP-hydrolysing) subunit A